MKQILFVDDKPAIGKVLSVYLGKENELVYFEDPVRAIEWLNEGNCNERREGLLFAPVLLVAASRKQDKHRRHRHEQHAYLFNFQHHSE